MKYFILMLSLLVTSVSHADCIFGLDNVSNVGGLKDVIRCLQDEINSIKGEESNNQSNLENRYYTIQIFATSNRTHAEEVRETFKSLGYEAFIQFSLNTTSDNKPIWHKVMIGKYKWESEAIQEKATIVLTHPVYKDSFVTSVIINN